MKYLLSLLASSYWVSFAFGQLLSVPATSYPKYEYTFPFRLEPYLDGTTSFFAYKSVATDGTERVFLDELIEPGPEPVSRRVAMLVEHDGLNDIVVDLIASPDNRYVAVYTFQDFGSGFVDHNFTFYDMQNGESFGLANEHRFAGLNDGLYESPVFETFKQAEIDMGVPAEVVATYDYTVVTEGAGIPTPRYGWNEDGTFALSFELDVMLDEGVYSFFIGSDEFTMNFDLSLGSVLFSEYGELSSASYPLVFSLSPHSNVADYVRFEGARIKRSILPWASPKSPSLRRPFFGELVEGNIPKRFTLVWD